MNREGRSSKINQIGLAKMFGGKLKGRAQYTIGLKEIKPGTFLNDRPQVNQVVGTLNDSKKNTIT